MDKKRKIVLISPKESGQQLISTKKGRNEKCACGSGKKQKHCCGDDFKFMCTNPK